MFKTRIACETPWKSNTLWPILRINSDTNCSQNWCLKILERTVTNQFIMYLRIHSISLNSPFFGEMNQLPPADIIPGWITIRNTIGQALVGIEPNKASRSTRLEDAWKPKLQLVHPKIEMWVESVWWVQDHVQICLRLCLFVSIFYFFWRGDVQDVSKTTPPWKCPIAEVTKGSQLESLRLMTLRAGEALSSPKPSPNSLPNNNIASKDGLKMFQKMIAKDASVSNG